MNYYLDEFNMSDVGDTYFMGYHTPLKKSSDWYKSLRAARLVSENITNMINNANLTDRQVRIFPYRYVRDLEFEKILFFQQFDPDYERKTYSTIIVRLTSHFVY